MRDDFVCTLVVPFVVGGGNISSKVGHKNDIKAVALPIKSSAQREIKLADQLHTYRFYDMPASELPNALKWILENLWMKWDGKFNVFTPWSFQIERLAAKFPAQNPTINLIASGRTCFYVIAYFEFLSTTLGSRDRDRDRNSTAVKPGINGLAFTMGKWSLTDNSATVGRVLMISSADPHEFWFW